MSVHTLGNLKCVQYIISIYFENSFTASVACFSTLPYNICTDQDVASVYDQGRFTCDF